MTCIVGHQTTAKSGLPMNLVQPEKNKKQKKQKSKKAKKTTTIYNKIMSLSGLSWKTLKSFTK